MKIFIKIIIGVLAIFAVSILSSMLINHPYDIIIDSVCGGFIGTITGLSINKSLKNACKNNQDMLQ